jgi:hypothetical protein
MLSPYLIYGAKLQNALSILVKLGEKTEMYAYMEKRAVEGFVDQKGKILWQ